MKKEDFQLIAPSIPHQPGCYKYFDAHKKLLYVGKAKDLRKRVSSYFNKNLDNFKTKRLVALIHSIEFTVTDSEHDAFLLENSLIKHYQPKFNISLKDDKTFPFVVIKKEYFPRVFVTRRFIKDGSEYIGPFTDVYTVKELLELVKMNTPLRNCTLNLSPANIAGGKFKVCLEYHLGNCGGPCEGLQSEEDYRAGLQQVRHILKGNTQEIVKDLKVKMMEHAAALEFEQAALIKKRIDAFQHYTSKSTVVNPHLGNLDVACIISDEQYAFVHYMVVNNGSIIYAKTLQIEKQLEETDEDILALALARQREKINSIAKEIIVPFPVHVTDESLVLTIPKIGDKKKLLDLGLKNAHLFQQALKRKQTLLLTPSSPEKDKLVLTQLQEALKMDHLPMHIECFDNSNFQGAFPVAAMVCFKNGQPSKADYRHFHIQTVQGIDDFASMKEVVFRRYKRLLDENKPLPQLVIIDGGKGQLGAAMESLQSLDLVGKMTVIGLAKREESIFFPGAKDPLQLPFDHPGHLLVRRIRDEVHRFGITFHRDNRSKGTIKNELENIKGIGAQTATELLKTFRSVKKIKDLTLRELTAAIGASKARLVYDYFHQEEA